GGDAVRAVRRQLEPGEEESPGLVDGPRIGLPSTVLLRDVVLVGEREPFESVHEATSLLAGVQPDGHPSPMTCGRPGGVAPSRPTVARAGDDGYRLRRGSPRAPPQRYRPPRRGGTPRHRCDSSPRQRRGAPTRPSACGRP